MSGLIVSGEEEEEEDYPQVSATIITPITAELKLSEKINSETPITEILKTNDSEVKSEQSQQTELTKKDEVLAKTSTLDESFGDKLLNSFSVFMTSSSPVKVKSDNNDPYVVIIYYI